MSIHKNQFFIGQLVAWPTRGLRVAGQGVVESIMLDSLDSLIYRVERTLYKGDGNFRELLPEGCLSALVASSEESGASDA